MLGKIFSATIFCDKGEKVWDYLINFVVNLMLLQQLTRNVTSNIEFVFKYQRNISERIDSR